MGSERGAANIRAFNRAKEEKNLALLREELETCRRSKLQFRKKPHLVAYLAERTGIHRTTLKRNLRYDALVAQHVAAQPGGAGYMHSDTDDPSVLKAKLALAHAELGNLRQQVRRLNAQLSQAGQPHGDCGASKRDEVDFANLCMLLTMVLTRAETFALDTKTKSLIDLAAKPSDRVIGGPERSAGFIAWVGRNEAAPFVNRLVRMD